MFEKYFTLFFSITEIILIIIFLGRFFYYKLLNHKSITATSISFFAFILFMFFCKITDIYSLYNNFIYIISIRTFLFLMEIIYAHIYFYKFSIYKKDNRTKNKKSIQEKIKKILYLNIISLFIFETMCIPLLSTSTYYIKYYEIASPFIIPEIYINIYEIPQILSLILLLNFQRKLRKNIINFSNIKTWIKYFIFEISSLLLMFIYNNFFYNVLSLEILIALIRIIKIFILSEIIFKSNMEENFL